MIIAILVILVIICIILGIKLSKKVEKDNLIIQENNKLHNDNAELIKTKNSLISEVNLLNNTKDNLFNETAKLQDNLNNSEQISNEAFANYWAVIEKSYKEIEEVYDLRKLELEEEFESVKEDLAKLKATRAAAHEAILKEQEVKDNKDNYRLIPSASDLADSRRLEIVKKELNKPRILCMLVWQTYWQPLAKKQFPLIIQAKTKCGIYKITNIVTDECYIGQSVDIYKRWCEHCKCGLGIDTPPGNKLYKAIQEYGLDNFTFELITECEPSELNEKEKYFISLYQADTFGYNGNIGVNK